MTLAMADLALRTGTDTIVATPHCLPGMYENYGDRYLEEIFRETRRVLAEAGIPLRLMPGMEVMLSGDVQSFLDEKQFWTLNKSQYLLVEFRFDEDPEFCSAALKAVVKKGFTPIVAHPERYYSVQDDPSLVYRWYLAGYGIQVNKDSILGRFGRSERAAALSLLRHNLVTCVASDAHGIRHRTPRLGELRSFLREAFGEDYTYMLMEENPRRILGGRRMVGYDPVAYSEGDS